MASNELVQAVCVTISDLLRQELRNALLPLDKKRKKRRVWVRKWILRRNTLGASETLLKELAVEDLEGYRNHLRMSEQKFNELLSKIEPKIKKQDTIMRKSLSPTLKLQITLRYLATGDSFNTLAFMYRVPKNTISNFIKPVCEAIYEALEKFIKVPHTEQDWKDIQNDYYNRWNFPNCCGALDGKHVVIRNAPHSGSQYFNYKGTYSVILLASVDANYCFRYIDVGTNGRANDAAVFSNCSLNAALEAHMLKFPKNGVFVGDDAFPLKTFLLKPYGRTTGLTKTQKIFNYRLSRARRIVENAFGILASRFRVFERPIAVGIDKVDIIIKTTCALHNWLRTASSEEYTPIGSFDTEDFNSGSIISGSWRLENNPGALRNLEHNIGSNNYTTDAAAKRARYAEYFCGPGAVPWQENMIHHHN